jgi:hypothetical protein
MKRREFLIAAFGAPLLVRFLAGGAETVMAQTGRVIRHSQSVSINASTRANLDLALTATRNAVASVGAESNA